MNALTSFMRRILLQIEYKRIPVYDLHVASDMNSREGIITRDHNALCTYVNNHITTHKIDSNSPDAKNQPTSLASQQHPP
jgi:hypothetical protein